MRTHQEARHVLTRFIRSYNNCELEDQEFRSVCFGLNILLSFFKTEKEEEHRKNKSLDIEQGNPVYNQYQSCGIKPQDQLPIAIGSHPKKHKEETYEIEYSLC